MRSIKTLFGIISLIERRILKRFKGHNTAYYKSPESLVAKHIKENPNHKIKFPDSIKLKKNVELNTTDTLGV